MTRDRDEPRRVRLVQLATEVAPMARQVSDDNDIRALLVTIVRRWPTRVVAYKSAEVRAGARFHLEHVVPVRVIVDRMIMNPPDCELLLGSCLTVAAVTDVEHRTIGTMLQTNAVLYKRMQACALADLVPLGWQRYVDQGVFVVDEHGRGPLDI